MPWRRFALFAGAAGLAWASYAALLGYVGGRAFEDNPLWGLLLGFGIAAATFVVVEVGRRVRRRRSATRVQPQADEPEHRAA